MKRKTTHDDPNIFEDSVNAISLSSNPDPTAKNLTDILKFLLSQLDYIVKPEAKLEDELFSVLKFLNCPHNINHSTFRHPHSFPLILAVMNWLVQAAQFKLRLSSHSNSYLHRFKRGSVMAYCLDTYLAYNKVVEKLEDRKHLLLQNLKSKDDEEKQLRLDLTTLKSTPSQLDTLESLTKDLEALLGKLLRILASLKDARSVIREEKEKELASKVTEIRQTNGEVEEETELPVEKEINEAESSRSSREEKCWDPDSPIAHKLRNSNPFLSSATRLQGGVVNCVVIEDIATQASRSRLSRRSNCKRKVQSDDEKAEGMLHKVVILSLPCAVPMPMPKIVLALSKHKKRSKINVGEKKEMNKKQKIHYDYKAEDARPGSIDMYTAQCNECEKWRTIETKEEYEQLRSKSIQEPFTCNMKPNASCDDPPNLYYDATRTWVYDEHNLPITPEGFKRDVILRPNYSRVDVYYITPDGKTLANNPQVVKYLKRHQELNNLKLENFKFTGPKIEKDTIPEDPERN